MGNFVKGFKRAAVVAAGVAAVVASGAASAAVDISADVTAAKADVGTNGALIVGVIVAIAAIAWIRRVIK